MILIFSACRSRCAMARDVRIGARCCLREWQRSSSFIWRRCEVCIARTLPRAMEGCAFPTPWGGSIPMHRWSGGGNGCFRAFILAETSQNVPGCPAMSDSHQVPDSIPSLEVDLAHSIGAAAIDVLQRWGMFPDNFGDVPSGPLYMASSQAAEKIAEWARRVRED